MDATTSHWGIYEDDMLSSRQRLGELLITHRLLTTEQLAQALEIQRRRPQPIGQILIQLGFITEERLLQACAVQKGVNAWHLQHDPPAPEALVLLPPNLCRAHMLIPVRVKPDRLFLAMRDPSDIDAIDHGPQHHQDADRAGAGQPKTAWCKMLEELFGAPMGLAEQGAT